MVNFCAELQLAEQLAQRKLNQDKKNNNNQHPMEALNKMMEKFKELYQDKNPNYNHLEGFLFKMDDIFKNVNYQDQAKDEFGNLHPQYIQPIRKGFEDVSDYVQLYSVDILNTIRQIDLLCIKTSNRNHDNYDRCKLQVNDDIHKKIFVPIVNSSVLLYKAANQCLLEGKSIDDCTRLVSEHTYFMFKLAAERIKLMTVPLTQKIPKQLIAPTFQDLRPNNSIY